MGLAVREGECRGEGRKGCIARVRMAWVTRKRIRWTKMQLIFNSFQKRVEPSGIYVTDAARRSEGENEREREEGRKDEGREREKERQTEGQRVQRGKDEKSMQG